MEWYMFGDLDWPLNASRGFVSIGWACCLWVLVCWWRWFCLEPGVNDLYIFRGSSTHHCHRLLLHQTPEWFNVLLQVTRCARILPLNECSVWCVKQWRIYWSYLLSCSQGRTQRPKHAAFFSVQSSGLFRYFLLFGGKQHRSFRFPA